MPSTLKICTMGQNRKPCTSFAVDPYDSLDTNQGSKNMELSKAILTRRSVRSFRKGNIPNDKIRELIKAAIYAPSAGSCQPWHFYVVNDSGIRKRGMRRLAGRICRLHEFLRGLLKTVWNGRTAGLKFVVSNPPSISFKLLCFLTRWWRLC